MAPPRLAVLRAEVVRAALLVVAAGALGACGHAQKPEADLVWPPPPEKPRIKFVRTLRNEGDLGPSAWKGIFRAIVPAEHNFATIQPSGLALSPDEKKLYVGCAAATWVIEFDFEKRTMRRVADSGGSTPGHPMGVAVDAEGNLYVADSRGRAVWVYGTDGKLLRRFGEKELERPTGLAVDRRRQLLYVVDGGTQSSNKHKVDVYTLKGEHLRTMGRRGTAAGEFLFPVAAAVAPNGDLYVSDLLNGRVQVFDAEGQLTNVFGTPGEGYGAFDKPKGIAFDSFGNVHVVDSGASIVQVFNSRFQPLMAYGGRSTDPGFVLLPGAIAIDSRNHIYVADFAFNRVNEYALINTTAADSFATPREPKPTQDVGKGGQAPDKGK